MHGPEFGHALLNTRIFVICRHSIPEESSGSALWHALAEFVHEAQVVLRLGMPLAGCLEILRQTPIVISGHALTVSYTGEVRVLDQHSDRARNSGHPHFLHLAFI